MNLVPRICILLLINFAIGTSEQNNDDDRCSEQYLNMNECYRQMPNGDHLFREINSTSQTYTGSDNDLDSIRLISKRYCDSGYRYLQCFDANILKPECEDADSLTTTNQGFADKLIKFGIEYICRNDAEAVFKITANNGLSSIINMETAGVLEICTSTIGRSDYSTSFTETFCANVDEVSDCILKYFDKLPNQDISRIIRDVIPQLKVIGECAIVA